MSTSVILCVVLVILKIFCSYIRLLQKRLAKVTIKNSIPSKGCTLQQFSQAPGPLPLPIIGNLIEVGKNKNNPFQSFNDLSEKYGDIFSLSLGNTSCVVVNNLDIIREVLNQNGKFFGGRPDFLRYHKLFGGDRNNSLALCDWSQLQQKRRNLARRHCSPRDSSTYFYKMSNIGCFEVNEMLDKLQKITAKTSIIEVKPLIQQTCANMFLQYMCSIRFDYDDTEFKTITNYFDEIFWEINQGYSLDFLPWLAPFYTRHTNKLTKWSSTIRKFILKRIIHNRERNIDIDEPEKDFTDALLKSLAGDKTVSHDTIMYMLEDFIGGHSAVGNLVMLALIYISKNINITKRIQNEIDRVSKLGTREINLSDMCKMPYTMATIFEVLRYSSSPIVPHVATEDCVISGYGIKSGTIVFINNYKLNTSEKFWQNPEKFQPERFLEKVTLRNEFTEKSRHKRRFSESSDSGIEFEKEWLVTHTWDSNDNCYEIVKNINVCQQESIAKIQLKKNIPYFLPFSIGKRTCIGQNLVRGFGFILLTGILQNYSVSCENTERIRIKPACVALPTKTTPLTFKKRLQPQSV